MSDNANNRRFYRTMHYSAKQSCDFTLSVCLSVSHVTWYWPCSTYWLPPQTLLTNH